MLIEPAPVRHDSRLRAAGVVGIVWGGRRLPVVRAATRATWSWSGRRPGTLRCGPAVVRVSLTLAGTERPPAR